MLLNLLRCLRGYVCFTVCGTYPERFINIALKNRLRLWNVVRGGDGLTACMYMRDYLRVRRYARASGVRLKISGRKGLPTLLRRYSDRVGLVIGAAAFVITVFVMSLFVWSIDITGLEDISESEMRALLAENGISVGAFKPAVDYQSAARSVMLSDSRVGWIAVNVTGSYASVEIKEQTPSPEVPDIDAPCNVKARRDGRIIRIDAEQGKTAVMEGSGIVKGQLIVSGVMEDQLGGVRLVHAAATVLAETGYRAQFRLPQRVTVFRPTGEVKRRLTADIFGIKLPLTVGGVSTVDMLSDDVEEVPAPLDVQLPAGLLTRRIYALEREEAALSRDEAKSILLREAQLYEAFTLSDCTVKKRSFRLAEDGGGYLLTADFTCEEDVAYQEEIGEEKEE